eukprot:159370-Alexandrium_andersonii.AAC.1
MPSEDPEAEYPDDLMIAGATFIESIVHAANVDPDNTHVQYVKKHGLAATFEIIPNTPEDIIRWLKFEATHLALNSFKEYFEDPELALRSWSLRRPSHPPCVPFQGGPGHGHRGWVNNPSVVGVGKSFRRSSNEPTMFKPTLQANQYHGGSELTFVEMYDEAPIVQSAWKAHTIEQGIKRSQCPTQGEFRYDKLYE